MTVKILSIGHSYVLSVNRRLPNEIARLTDGKWEVTTVAPTKISADFRRYTIDKQIDELSKVRDIPIFLSKIIHGMYYHPHQLNEIINDSNYNLIHAWEEPYIIAGYQIACQKSSKVPLIYRTAQSYNKKYPLPFALIEKYSMSQASGWICSGQLVAQALQGRPEYQLPTKLIPLGVDPKLFFPDRQQGESILTALNWGDSNLPVIGYLGRLVPEKGIRVLMEVLDRLSTPWRMLFVGSGYLSTEIEAWSSKFPDRVRVVTDAIHTDIPKYLNMMDLVVVPSQTYPNWREQFGRVPIEAMACKIPVIGSSSGELPYVIDNAGVVVPESNIAQWIEEIENMLDSPRKRQELATLGLERVRSNYSWEKVARSHIDFFKEIMATSPVRR